MIAPSAPMLAVDKFAYRICKHGTAENSTVMFSECLGVEVLLYRIDVEKQVEEGNNGSCANVSN